MSRFVIALASALILATTAHAQWPTKPVRIIVNVGPGVADTMARMIGARLAERLGQPFVVENRPGADGAIGFEAVGRADADGYMFVYSPGGAMMISPHLSSRPDFDPLKLLVPVVATAQVSLYVLVHPGLPVVNYPELLGHARAKPGKLNVGSPGNGSAPHIAMEVFSREAGVRLNHVPYKGAGPVMNDLLGGVLDFTFDPGVGLAQAKAGKLRMIAVAGPVRHPDFPEVPTFEENGIKDVDGGPYFGLYAPAKTPRVIIERLNREVTDVLREPASVERMRSLAVQAPPAMSPAAFADYVRRESARYAKLLRELNVAK